MMYRPSTAFLLVFLAVTTAVFSQTRPAKPAPPLWGKALPAQPFDTQTFREIALPDWLEETTRVTYCYSVMSAAMRSVLSPSSNGSPTFSDNAPASAGSTQTVPRAGPCFSASTAAVSPNFTLMVPRSG